MTACIDRRGVVGGLAAGAMLAPRAARGPRCRRCPKAPVALSIIDVGGALALLQAGFDAYKADKPNLVSKITYVKAPAPELAGKIKAQQDAGKSDLDLVLTSSDALSAGLELGLWTKIFPDFQDAFPGIEANYEPTALKLFKAQGAGLWRRLRLLSLRPAPRICARAREASAEDGSRASRLGEGQSQSLHVCAPGEFRSRQDLHHGPALSSRRQGPEGPGQRLGQDLGLSQGAQPRDRILSDAGPA